MIYLRKKKKKLETVLTQKLIVKLSIYKVKATHNSWLTNGHNSQVMLLTLCL